MYIFKKYHHVGSAKKKHTVGRMSIFGIMFLICRLSSRRLPPSWLLPHIQSCKIQKKNKHCTISTQSDALQHFTQRFAHHIAPAVNLYLDFFISPLVLVVESNPSDNQRTHNHKRAPKKRRASHLTYPYVQGIVKLNRFRSQGHYGAQLYVSKTRKSSKES